jgi:hypothetical protein
MDVAIAVERGNVTTTFTDMSDQFFLPPNQTSEIEFAT